MSLYWAAGQHGISPPEVNRSEFFELAAAVGYHMTDETDPAAGDGRSLIEERIRRHRAGLPPPEPEATDPTGFQALAEHAQTFTRN